MLDDLAVEAAAVRSLESRPQENDSPLPLRVYTSPRERVVCGPDATLEAVVKRWKAFLLMDWLTRGMRESPVETHDLTRDLLNRVFIRSLFGPAPVRFIL